MERKMKTTRMKNQLDNLLDNEMEIGLYRDYLGMYRRI